LAVRRGAVEDLVNSGFWSGKSVLITGHTGFKGAWLAIWLDRLGARLHGYALPPPAGPSLFSAANIEQCVETTYGDVRDLERFRDAVGRAQPEIIFHLAAQSLVRASYEDPVGTYATNVMGAVNLLEVVRSCKSVRAVLIVTSDKCYENQEWLWGYREDEPLGGHDPYSSSKACAELVAAAYRRSFFSPLQYPQHRVAIATARAGNVIGGGDWAEDRLVRFGRGNMCWSPRSDTSPWLSNWRSPVQQSRKDGISDPMTMTPSRSLGWSSIWSNSGGRGPAGAWMIMCIRTRPTV